MEPLLANILKRDLPIIWKFESSTLRPATAKIGLVVAKETVLSCKNSGLANVGEAEERIDT